MINVNINKPFVKVPAGTDLSVVKATSEKVKKIYFVEDRNLVVVNGVTYGVTPELLSRLSDSETSIANLQDTVAALTGDNGTITEIKSELSSAVESVKSELSEAVASVAADVTALSEAAAANAESIASNAADITTLMGEADVDGSVKSLISSAQSELSESIASVATDVTALSESLESAKSELSNAIATNAETIASNADAIAVLMGEATDEGSVKSLISAAQEELSQSVASVAYNVTALSVSLASVADDVTVLSSAIDTLNGEGEGSVKKAVADAIADVVASAPSDFDTLKEVADWIANDTTGAAKMQNDIATLMGEADVDGSVKSLISGAQAELSESVASVAADVTELSEAIATNAEAINDNAKSIASNAAAIDILNGDADTDGSVAKAIADAIADAEIEPITLSEIDMMFGVLSVKATSLDEMKTAFGAAAPAISEVTVPAEGLSVTESLVIEEGKKVILTLDGDVDTEVSMSEGIYGAPKALPYIFGIKKGAKLVIKGNGKVVLPKSDSTKVFANDGGELIIEGGDYTANIPVINGSDAKTVIKDGKFNSQECCVLIGVGSFNSELIIDGGTFNAADNAVIMDNGTKNSCSGNVVTINGGTFNGYITDGSFGNGQTGYVACGVYLANDNTLNIKGGTFNITRGCGVLARAGKTVIDGATFKCTGETIMGRVGDARTCVECVPVIFDESAAYPGLKPESGIKVVNMVGTSNVFDAELNENVTYCLLVGDSKNPTHIHNVNITSRIAY